MEKTFSQRMGFKPVKSIIQSDSMSPELRNGIWNAICLCYFEKFKKDFVDYGFFLQVEKNTLKFIFQRIWHHYFKKPLDNLSNEYVKAYNEVRRSYFSCKWYEIYDFVEFMLEVGPNKEDNREFIDWCNGLFKRELSAYRFVNGKLARITSDEEIAEIEEAQQIPMSPVRTHLNAALGLLADRENPDYRNSIKESIHAIEALCKQILGEDKTTLGKALNMIEREGKVKLHKALKGAFSQIYGYSSDEDGLRHCMLKDPNLDFEDAKFMLVACSAFTNYLYTKADKANIKLSE